MKRFAVTACAVAALSGCMVEPASVGGPQPSGQREVPVIGSVTGFVGGQPASWETLDYSIGAPDATARISGDQGRFVLTVEAFPPGTGGERAGRITLQADLPNGPVPGPGTSALITLHDTEALDGPGYRSIDGALLNVSTLSRRDGLYGDIAGSFVGRLCRAEGPAAPTDPADCLDVAGEFETGLQLLYPEF